MESTLTFKREKHLVWFESEDGRRYFAVNVGEDEFVPGAELTAAPPEWVVCQDCGCLIDPNLLARHDKRCGPS